MANRDAALRSDDGARTGVGAGATVAGDVAADRSTPGSWAALLDALKQQRRSSEPPRPMRAQAEAMVMRVMALLFPPFAREARGGPDQVDDEAGQLERLLHQTLGPLVPDAGPVVQAFLARLPGVHEALVKDAQAITSGDPAAGSLEEVIAAYPGFLAMAVHRMAHELYRMDVPMFPRVLSEWSHRETGIDIHPGAHIGAGFAIDHGTGVVIGETSEIGDRVRIYQGVTLGALAVSKQLANRKRHPTIGNDVVIYANATILGGNTVVGDGSVIGGNVWLTSSVPPRSIVQFTSRVEKRGGDDGIEFHI